MIRKKRIRIISDSIIRICMIFELDNLDPADWFIPVHEEDVGNDVDQIENIAEDQLEGPVAVAPVVIYNKYLQIYISTVPAWGPSSRGSRSNL